MTKSNIIEFAKKSPEVESPEKSQALPTADDSTVIYLGIVMFLMNFSFLMFFSLFPAYLMSLGHSQTSIGVYEGIFEFISQILKFSSGFISDILRRRQALVLLGCSIIFAGRAMLGFSKQFYYMILGRSIDRIGNGLYSIPRDALIAAAAPENKRAQSLGFARSLGQVGAFTGSIFASLLMGYCGFAFKDVFALSVIPSFLILLIVFFKVKEIPFEKKEKGKLFKFSELRELGTKFALLMFIAFIFSLGRCNEAFMGPYAMRTFGFPVDKVPYVMTIFNISYTLCAYPIGILSDKFGRTRMLVLGILALITADMFFFFANSLSMFFVGVVFWGIQVGITQNTFMSLIIDTVSPNLRGTAFGVFFLISAVCLFCADSTGGYISDVTGSHAYMYLASSICGLVSLIVLGIVTRVFNYKLSLKA